ncbi:MAG TPA: MFS transporter, partial [bacterium]|nr:MFS transporter [bacterium]
MNRRILAVLSYGHLATDLAQGAIPALLPVFKALFHLSYAGVGFIVLLANISSSVVQPAFGFLSDRLALRWLMPLGALMAGLGIILSVLSTQYTWTVTLILISGLGVAAFHPEGYRYAGLAAGDRRATGMSYFSLGGNIGYGLGPAAATLALS